MSQAHDAVLPEALQVPWSEHVTLSHGLGSATHVCPDAWYPDSQLHTAELPEALQVPWLEHVTPSHGFASATHVRPDAW